MSQKNKKLILSRKVFRQIHLILALLSGLVICIVSLTGVLYAFAPEIISLLNPKLTHQTKNVPNFNHMLTLFKNQFPNQKLQAIELYSGHRPILWISKTSEYNAFFLFSTQEIVKFVPLRSVSFFETVIGPHRNLLLGQFGSKIVSYSVFIFVFFINHWTYSLVD